MRLRTFGLLAPASMLILLMTGTLYSAIATPSNESSEAVLTIRTNDSAAVIETEILAEMNRARTNPQGYAAWLETLRPHYSGTVLQLPNEVALRTREGTAALDDAIAFLQLIPALPPLQQSAGMSQAAQDLVDDLGQTGVIGSRGSDGSTASDRIGRYGSWSGSLTEMTSYGNRTAIATVVLLILNDGDVERNLRRTLFDPAFQVVGIGCGIHTAQQTMCVMNYATAYADAEPMVANPEMGDAVSVSDAEIEDVAVQPAEVESIEPEPTEVETVEVPEAIATVPSPSESDAAINTEVTEVISSADFLPSTEPTSGKVNTDQATRSTDELIPSGNTSTSIATLIGSYDSLLQPVSYLSPFEQAIVAETNRLRADPSAYAEQLANLRQYYRDRILHLPGLPPLETVEGITALDEAIAVLRETDPLPLLEPSRGLSLGARDHVNDLGVIGATGHYGSDGSTYRDRIHRYGTVPADTLSGENISYSPLSDAQWHVIQLVIDDGVPSRGHREALLRAEYRLTGVACGTHAAYQEMCAIIYAGDFVELD
ncbi:hypothetical protein H6G89_00850 [Oscillatoria sp. FACHB-1407]|uniref:CAP domain-containing protein n=1 Tax=Oscillatoria sp. FACHB-1407 TaxID=2692847 RepID=UPI0016879DEF|nr:CAP domain-containing protein [Oscillatoria sp. FACHB-1407]MBD2459578.1 hypothetical protein [Oscillatoria sp. FACHB-1407]